MIVDFHGEGGSISYFEYQEGRFRNLYRAKGTASLGAFYALKVPVWTSYRFATYKIKNAIFTV
jgi:hypothetical protein